MLDAFIIEELKRRERQEDRPQPEAPGPGSANDERDDRSPQKSGSDEEKPQRGVVIIDYSL